MNYLTSVFVNNQQKIYAIKNEIKNGNVIANTAKTLSPVGWVKRVLTRFLMMSCLILAFMRKNSVASGHDIFSTVLFCEAECSEFVLIPAAFGVGVGALVGAPVGVGLGVPVCIGMGAAMVVAGDKPEKILRHADSTLWFSTILATAGGAQVFMNVVAFPFWVAEKVVYDAPLKVVKLVRANF